MTKRHNTKPCHITFLIWQTRFYLPFLESQCSCLLLKTCIMVLEELPEEREERNHWGGGDPTHYQKSLHILNFKLKLTAIQKLDLNKSVLLKLALWCLSRFLQFHFSNRLVKMPYPILKCYSYTSKISKRKLEGNTSYKTYSNSICVKD